MPQGPEPGARHRAHQDAAAAPLHLSAQALFYPAAALYAAAILPLSVLWMPQWHAHEMLFGFALAVVAGNQLGPATGTRVWVLFGLWIVSRIAFLAFPGAVTAMVVNAGFAAGLALQVAPRLLRAAKKWRNQALPAILIALCVAAAAFHIRSAVLLFAALMLFMGGRILAPSVAGQMQRQGLKLGPRVQPRIEAGLLVAMALAFFHPAFCIAAGALAGLRMLRWRLWALRGRPDLLCLAAGYGWLVVGLVAYGVRPEPVRMHLITVGALGTLTLNVMALSWLLRARRDPARAHSIVWGTLFLGAAGVLRLLGVLEAAAFFWSAAFLLLLNVFLRNRGQSSSCSSGSDPDFRGSRM
jgi:uncharacterized protein involved in response to NO